MDQVNQALTPPPAPPPEQQAPPLAGPDAAAGASSPAPPGPPPEVLPPPPPIPQVINVNLGGTNRRKVTVRRGPSGELLGADVEEGVEAEPVEAPAPEVPLGE